jgi:hypothetical protein
MKENFDELYSKIVIDENLNLSHTIADYSKQEGLPENQFKPPLMEVKQFCMAKLQ